ncbi:MAG: efflux RND transporter permease subunit, partial [Desulfovibrionaceae bacterium]|nr:efflux RND transporter permease subunit [Desulfovibrionaceae bacterium]
TLLASLVLLVGTGWLFAAIPKGFLPFEDEGFINGTTEATQSISFEGMKRAQEALDDILMNNPAVDRYNSLVGMAGPITSTNNGRLSIRLKPHKERKPIEQELSRLRRELNSTPGLQVYLSIPPMINIGGRSTKALYQYTLQSPDTNELYTCAEAVERAVRALPMLQDVNSDLQLKNPEVHVEIDRAKAAALGITPAQIELALQSAYGSREISTIYTPTNDYKVYVQLLPRFQKDPSALSKLYVRSKDGMLVPLDTLASLRTDVGPMSVNHSGQFPAVTISYNLRPGVSLGEAVAAVEQVSRPLLPESVTAENQGTAQAFRDSLHNMGVLIVLAIVVIYLVLGMLYESFIHPLTILSGLPSAGFGALATLWLFGADLNLYAFVGVIMLIGIVKKNAIMMLDFALEAQRRDASLGPLEAITEGCLVRFRPIMMTTMAALMGALPIAIGIGAGAEARRPLGLAVVGGLCFSQLITLYITPVYYYYLERISGRLKARFAKNFTQMDDEYARQG